MRCAEPPPTTQNGLSNVVVDGPSTDAPAKSRNLWRRSGATRCPIAPRTRRPPWA